SRSLPLDAPDGPWEDGTRLTYFTNGASMKIACSQCGTGYDVPSGAAGRSTQCKACGHRFTIEVAPEGPGVIPSPPPPLVQPPPADAAPKAGAGRPLPPPPLPPRGAPAHGVERGRQLLLMLIATVVFTVGVLVTLLVVLLLVPSRSTQPDTGSVQATDAPDKE